MRNFIFGGFVTILALVILGVGAALMGYVPTRANATPPRLEEQLAMSALDASMQRHAPRVSNPVSPTDENLIEGMKIYTMNCSGCHGGLDRQPVELGRSFYPPAPNLILDPLDDPEWHIFYAVRTGVRYTGMPAWEKNLSAVDIWKVTAFLARVGKLPPAVQDYWKKAIGTPTPAPAPTESEHKGHKTRSSK
jgi:mono/diheme cytochrome c family protein